MRISVLNLTLLKLLLVFFPGTGMAQVMIDDVTEEYAINPHIRYSIEGDRNFDGFNDFMAYYKKKELIRNKAHTNNLDLGISWNNYLLYIPLQNNTDKDAELEICIPNPNIKKITFFQVDDRDSLVKSFQTGKDYIFSSRPVLNRNFIFPFLVKAGAKNAVYLSLYLPDSYFFAPVQLNKSGVFQSKDMASFLFYIFFTCLMLSSIIISAVCAAIYRAVIFLLYAAYIWFSTLFFLSNEGLDFQFFYPNSPKVALTSDPNMYAVVALVALLQLTLIFFKTEKPFRLVTYLLNGWRILVLALFITLGTMHLTGVEMNPIEHFQISFTDVFYVIFIISTWILIVTLIVFFKIKKMPNSGLFLLSIAGLMMTVTYTILYTIGIIHKIYMPVNLMPVSFALEVIFLSVALLYRSKKIESAKGKLETELRDEQHHSAGKQISLQELERSRIAKDLHDEIGSNLASLKIQVEQIDKTDRATSKQIATIMDVINSSSKSLHEITHNLMPPSFNSMAFPDVLDKYFDKIKQNQKIYFDFYIHNYSEAFLKEEELVIYRIILELCHNIIKHSQSNSASIQLFYTVRSLNIVAEDNGIGIENKHTGLGLESVKSRVKYLNGTLNTDSSKKGTLISLHIPYKIKYENTH